MALFQVKNNFNKRTILLAEKLFKKGTVELKSICRSNSRKLSISDRNGKKSV